MARLSLPSFRRRSPKRGAPAKKRLDLRAAITKIRALTRRRWQAVALAGLALSFGLYWFGLRPATAELDTARADAATAERRAGNLLVEYEDLQSPEGAAAAERRFDRAAGYDILLPASIKNLDMLNAITRIATAAGLELGPSAPGGAPSAGPAEALQFQVFTVTLTGEFERIVEFLEGVKAAEPLMTVWSASFVYLPGNPETGVPAKVELTAEIRFWSSELTTLAETKAKLDRASGRNDSAEESAATSPTETTPPPTLPTDPPADSTPAEETVEADPAQVSTSPDSGQDPRFASCEDATSAGYGPYERGVDPEYAWYSDRDDDGIVCE